MDSEPNTYKHERVMTAGVYIAVPCLKIQSSHPSRIHTVCTCFYPQRKKEFLCNIFQLYQITLTILNKSSIVQTPVLANIH